MQDAKEAISGAKLEAVILLHLCQCGTCGVYYAAPLVLYTNLAANAGLIHCPNGHANTAAPIGAGGTPGGMAAELQQLRFEKAQHEQAAARFGPVAITLKELRRRARTLSELAEPLKYGQVICPYCGKRKQNQSSLRNHLYRQHEEDLRVESAEKFQ